MEDLTRILLDALTNEEMKERYKTIRKSNMYGYNGSEEKVVSKMVEEVKKNLSTETIHTGNEVVDQILTKLLEEVNTEEIASELCKQYKPLNGRNGKQAADSQRKLTEEEKEFVAKSHNLIYAFCRDYGYNVNEDDTYGILAEALIYATKKYVTDQKEKLKDLAFSTVAYGAMKTAMSNKRRANKTKGRMPEGGLVSLDYEIDNDRLNSEGSRIEVWWIDNRINIENQVTCNEIYKEFRRHVKNLTYGEDSLKIIDLLLYGFTKREVVREMKKIEGNYWNREMLDYELKRLRKIFKNYFGI